MNALTVTRSQLEEASLPTVLFDDDELVPVTEHFVVDSLEKALWTGSRIAQAQRNLDEISSVAKSFHERIDLWLQKASSPHLDSMAYLGSLLKPFVTERLTGVRARSITVPGYRIGLRSSPGRVIVESPDVAIRFLETAHPDAVQVKKEVVKSAVKPLLVAGASIPGLSLSPGEENLYVVEDQ